MFESESNWSSFNQNLIDYVKIGNNLSDMPKIISVCVSCGNCSSNPSSDHFFQEEEMLLCEKCYLDYYLLNSN